MNLKNKLLKGFTLVELIIVIAIVAILSVAAFLVVTKWIGKSRDTRRLSDLGSITRAFTYFKADPDNWNKDYPMPNGTIKMVKDAGNVVWYWGDMQNGVVDHIGTIGNYLNDPTTNQPYEYSVTHDMKEYQVKVILEGSDSAYLNNAYAIQGKAKIEGEYDGVILAKTGTNVYLFRTPSLFVDLDKTQYVEGEEIPITTSLKILEDDKIIDEISTGNFQEVDISALDQGIDDGTTIQQVADKLFDGDLTKAESFIEHLFVYEVEVETSCLSGINYQIEGGTGYTIGSPTRINQEWTYSTIGGTCTFNCQSGLVYNSVNNKCVTDECKGTKPSLGNYLENGTVGYLGTWNHNIIGGLCTFECNDGYYYNGVNCISVPVGSYTNIEKDTITNCTNIIPINSEYTTNSINGENNCSWECKSGFEYNSGNNQCEEICNGKKYNGVCYGTYVGYFDSRSIVNTFLYDSNTLVFQSSHSTCRCYDPFKQTNTRYGISSSGQFNDGSCLAGYTCGEVASYVVYSK